MNPDLRRFVRSEPKALPSTAPLLEWVGRPYPQGACWKLVRDAFRDVAEIDLPEDYYAAVPFFTQVHDARTGGAFTPQPWDVVMLRTVDSVPILVLHPGLVIDDKLFLQTWADAGSGIFRMNDERLSHRIVGYLRLLNR